PPLRPGSPDSWTSVQIVPCPPSPLKDGAAATSKRSAGTRDIVVGCHPGGDDAYASERALRGAGGCCACGYALPSPCCRRRQGRTERTSHGSVPVQGEAEG